MSKKLIMIAPLVILLVACGSTGETTSSDDKIIKTAKRKVIQLKNLKNESTSIKQVIYLNNQKFKLLTQEVIIGGKVFNLLTKEEGTIRGSIVVVTENFTSILAVDSKKIAKDTFRLTPNDKQKLHELYRNLIKDKKYNVIELEIDYSPTSTVSTI